MKVAKRLVAWYLQTPLKMTVRKKSAFEQLDVQLYFELSYIIKTLKYKVPEYSVLGSKSLN